MVRVARSAALLAFPWVLSACVVVSGPGGAGTATGPAPEEPPASEEGASAEERIAREIFDRVDAERQERGLEPLEWNDSLAEVAREWSVEMSERGRLEHQDVSALLEQDQRLDGFQGIGENIFTSSGPVPAGAIHVGWMRSDGHRVNVLNPGWNRLGIGVHCADDGSVWATQQFGRTVDADRPQVARTTPPQDPIARPEEDGPTCG